MKTRFWRVLFSLGFGLALSLTLLSVLITQISALSPAGELRVCPAGPPACDHASLQAAVDAAASGDVIKVATGVYNDMHSRPVPPGYGGPATISQLVYISKTVTIQGGYTTGNWAMSNPAANPTTLDAGGQGRVVVIAGAIAPTLQGLRITTGNATGLGGGIWGAAHNAGGGIYIVTATATIQDCAIFSNTAATSGTGGGGGLYLLASPSMLTHNLIYSNTASMDDWGEGGGLSISQSRATLEGNTIEDNAGNSQGAGIGGGLYIEGGYPWSVGPSASFHNNIFLRNTASARRRGDGGGIYIGQADRSVFVNTVVIDNINGASADSRGAGIAVEVSAPQFYHTTLARNTGGDGSGMMLFFESDVRQVNAIITEHQVGITVSVDSQVRVEGVLWHENGHGNIGGTGAHTVTRAVVGAPAFAADGFHLNDSSRAIDAALSKGVTDDIDGQVRPYPRYPQDNVPDLGADEWYPTSTSTATPTRTPTATRTPTPTLTGAPTRTPTSTATSGATLHLPLLVKKR
ncbi:MAG: hypothetical protein AUK03_00865 [Anaerolineae bacterium CG2_30_64_16]|nr:MAG: hypothetical protein AUK03_00865 [Anaerolineae bacterium CG2_30_64_16]